MTQPHPPINELAIVTALSWKLLAQTGINASPSEMGAVQGKRTVFSTCLCIEEQQWPTQSQPRHFQSRAQRQPCCLHPSSAPTHLPLSHPFCCRRTYLVKSLQEVTSQEECFMPDISGYIRERVKLHTIQCIKLYSNGTVTRSTSPHKSHCHTRRDYIVLFSVGKKELQELETLL